MFLLYKSNIITQQNGLEYSDTQVLLIQNFSNFASLNIEMIKYQTTDDIWGFSWNGRRKDSDYDTRFALNDKVK